MKKKWSDHMVHDIARYWTGLMLVSGIAIGGIVTGLNAQPKAPGAYVVIDISEITDPETFKTLLPKAPPAIAAFGGHFIVRTEKILATDGTPPKRVAIIAFDDLEKAKAWNASAAQQEVTELRLKSTTSRQFLVEALVMN